MNSEKGKTSWGVIMEEELKFWLQGDFDDDEDEFDFGPDEGGDDEEGDSDEDEFE